MTRSLPIEPTNANPNVLASGLMARECFTMITAARQAKQGRKNVGNSAGYAEVLLATGSIFHESDKRESYQQSNGLEMLTRQDFIPSLEKINTVVIPC